MKILERARAISGQARIFDLLNNFICALVAAYAAPLAFLLRRRTGSEPNAVSQPS
tara:strand:- start:194 stop:358 length:165 start_codon:yes stop_codon:yes gene_type:complete